jgi:hypothetical protein
MEKKMKSEIFTSAITRRNKIRFVYGTDEILIEPYYLSKEKNGKKVIYGRMCNTNEIKKFEYNKIANIKILKDKKFSPIIPIIVN